MAAIESDALRSFAVFAQHRNFTSAAAELHIAQPSLHVKITKLAAALGVTLYERDGRGLVLTPAGQRLAAFASDTRRRTEDFLGQLDGQPASVAIATGRGALRWVLGDALRSASRRGTQIRLVVADRAGVLAAVSSGSADLAVLAHDRPPARLDAAQIARYPQVLLLPAGHPLAGRSRVRLRDLDGLDLVVPPADRPHRQSLERALLDAGISWRASAEVDGWDLLGHLVELGLGASIVNGCVPAPSGLVTVPITDLPAVRYWLAWRAPRRSTARTVLGDLKRS